MSKLEIVEVDKIGIRAELMDVPLQLCMENGDAITDMIRCYGENAAIQIDDVLLVKDAP